MTSISIFVTIGNERYGVDSGDSFIEALNSYLDLADEVVIVDGNGGLSDYNKYKNVKVVENIWPYEFSWEQLPKAMNVGLEASSGDIVIRCDADYIFHEDDIPEIKKRIEVFASASQPVITMQKFCFTTHDRYYEKGGLPIVINKKLVGDSIKFGQAKNTSTDLCYPIRVTGTNDKGIPEGYYEPDTFAKIGLPVYVYDYSFKTKRQTKEEFWRFAKAYQRYFGSWKFGDTKERAFEVFMDMMRGRYKRCVYKIGEEKSGWVRTHPKYIQKKIDVVTPEMFCYDGWGELS